MHWGDMFTMHGWLWLFWLLVLLAVVIAVVGVVRAAGGTPGQKRDESPEQILKKRLARGEIDEQEYEQKLKQLRS